MSRVQIAKFANGVSDSNQLKIERLLLLSCAADGILARQRNVKFILEHKREDTWAVTFAMFDMVVPCWSSVQLLRKARQDGWLRKEMIGEYKGLANSTNADKLRHTWDMIMAGKDSPGYDDLAPLRNTRNKILAHLDDDVPRNFVTDHADYLEVIPFGEMSIGGPLRDSHFPLARHMYLDLLGVPLASHERENMDDVLEHASQTQDIIQSIQELVVFMSLVYIRVSRVKLQLTEKTI